MKEAACDAARLGVHGLCRERDLGGQRFLRVRGSQREENSAACQCRLLVQERTSIHIYSRNCGLGLGRLTRL